MSEGKLNFKKSLNEEFRESKTNQNFANSEACLRLSQQTTAAGQDKSDKNPLRVRNPFRSKSKQNRSHWNELAGGITS
jgi:hypothetical protein